MVLRLTDGCVETNGSEIDFGLTLCESGQAFRWERAPDGSVRGIAGGRAVAIWQDGPNARLDISRAEYDSFWGGYFSLDDDYSPLNAIALSDGFIAKCLYFGKGLRIVRQDFWETLASFILSANNNIARIKKIIGRLCENYGERVGEFGRAFPPPERLIGIGEADLAKSIGCGYRAKYLLDAAAKQLEGRFDGIGGDSYETQAGRLTQCAGVGKKVADCVILFGLHNLGAFPVDVWIERIGRAAYGGRLDASNFGDLAGVAQQYLFYYAINNKNEIKGLAGDGEK